MFPSFCVFLFVSLFLALSQSLCLSRIRYVSLPLSLSLFIYKYVYIFFMFVDLFPAISFLFLFNVFFYIGTDFCRFVCLSSCHCFIDSLSLFFLFLSLLPWLISNVFWLYAINPLKHGALYAPPSFVFYLLFKIHWGNPYLKILEPFCCGCPYEKKYIWYMIYDIWRILHAAILHAVWNNKSYNSIIRSQTVPGIKKNIKKFSFKEFFKIGQKTVRAWEG